MADPAQLLAPSRIECGAAQSSRKRVLERLGELLDVEADEAAASAYECLLSRERLGSTGIGYGVAIPHGRSTSLTEARAALLTLSEGVDYDAIDGQPVDVFYALLVPADAAEAHLETLATLAQMFSDDRFTKALREAPDATAAERLFMEWSPYRQSA